MTAWRSLVDEWVTLLRQHRSILKARRSFIKAWRWTEADWYDNWDLYVGPALEAALRDPQVLAALRHPNGR